MARPRMFVSSTYYDLRHVRADLKEFGREVGLDVVLFERGEVPYESDEFLEEACFREIESCDIVVSVVGGRSGTRSRVKPDSTISEAEVKRALELGRQLFFFVDQSIYALYPTWAKSGEFAPKIPWSGVEDTRVFNFIKFIMDLEINNAMFTFDTSQDIIRILREQFAGLFKSLLQRRARVRFESRVNQLVEAIGSAERLISYLKEAKEASGNAMQDILFTRHPVFSSIQLAVGTRVRVFFESEQELDELLRVLGYQRIQDQELIGDMKRAFWWVRDTSAKKEFLGVHRTLFNDNGALRTIGQDQWKDQYILTSADSS